MIGPLYTTIDKLREDESDRHLVNLVVERSNGVITDADVSSKLHQMIHKASRRFDGFIRGYVEVPIEDTETAGTGTASIAFQSTTVTGVGTTFDIEFDPGDIFVFDGQTDVICVVKSVTSPTELELSYEFYGETIPPGTPVTFTLYDTNVPAEVEEIVRNYTLYRLWRRRGRHDDQNPWLEAKTEMKELANRIQKGLYRFDTVDGEEIDHKEVSYNKSDKTMTDTAFEGYIDLEA